MTLIKLTGIYLTAMLAIMLLAPASMAATASLEALLVTMEAPTVVNLPVLIAEPPPVTD